MNNNCNIHLFISIIFFVINISVFSKEHRLDEFNLNLIEEKIKKIKSEYSDTLLFNPDKIGKDGFFKSKSSNVSISTHISIKTIKYLDDEKNGYFIRFYKNGVLNSYMEYKLGKANGTQLKYFKNGQIQYIVQFVDNKAVSMKQWDEKGKLLNSEKFAKPQTLSIKK